MVDTLRKELTFEGGVNLNSDPHLLKSNEWLKLQNMWPYKSKLIGTRPSLLHEQDLFPVPESNWNSDLYYNSPPVNPTEVQKYGQWFRHLTPLKAVFMGSLDRIALICVCNADDLLTISEHFEGEEATDVLLKAGEVVLMLLPNNLQTGPEFPKIAAVRLGGITNLTPSLIQFNGSIIAANKTCEYVVQVVPSSTLITPSVTVWPNIDYRFTKVNFGDNNKNFKVDGVIVYKNRFVYWRANKLWFSDPFEPGRVYDNAVDTAYLAVFFDTELTEDITALGNVYMSDVEEAGKSVLAIWTQHGMLFMTGEPATTIASTAAELFTDCKVNTISAKAGCVSAASLVKTKIGYIWCGAESVWYMAKGNLPVEVGLKISPRIAAQSFESAGRIFATFDDLCYRLVINAPNVGFNQYSALNEMWCLSFMGQPPSAESAAWFGPQVFTNTDNPNLEDNGDPEPYGPGGINAAGLYCCAKLTNINDDKTWYIQPYSYRMGTGVDDDLWGTRIGLASLSSYLGVDITAPFRMVAAQLPDYDYQIGAIVQNSIGEESFVIPYGHEFVVVTAGIGYAALVKPVVSNSSITVVSNKRLLLAWMEGEGSGTEPLPEPYEISIQSGNMTLDNPDLEKLVDGYELTFKTLNPITLNSWWWPWEPVSDPTNIVFLESTVNVPHNNQNVLGNMWNEPVLTARRIPAPEDKRYNGITAQLNVEDTEYKIVATNRDNSIPNWNKIRVGTDTDVWQEFELFDFNDDGIAKYETLAELVDILKAKVLLATGKELLVVQNACGYGMKFVDDSPFYIDLTYQGWEWFGFVPTGLLNYFGDINVITNAGSPDVFISSTGPTPCNTPRVIHFAKLSVRYRIFETRPR